MALQVTNTTISSGGVVTLTIPALGADVSGIYKVNTFADALADDITSFTGLVAGAYELVELWVHTTAHWWTLKHNPANGIWLQYGQDFETSDLRDFILLRGIGTNQVKEVMRGRFFVP